MNVILSSFYCLLSRLTLVTLSFSYVNVILSSLYCLLSYLSLVMLSLLLCECHLVFPLLSFVILITCYVKFSPMWMSSCLSFYCLLSYLSLVMLSLLLCECHLVFPLLSFVECHLVFPLLSFVILITCYVKFAPMRMSSCLSSIVFCHTYHLLC